MEIDPKPLLNIRYIISGFYRIAQANIYLKDKSKCDQVILFPNSQ